MHPTWFVWKINDRTRGGVPDVHVVGNCDRLNIPVSLWAEFKNCTEHQNPVNLLTALQLNTCVVLSALGENVFVVGLHPNGTQTVWKFDRAIATYAIGPAKDAFQRSVEAVVAC